MACRSAHTLACSQVTASAAQALAVFHIHELPDLAQQVAWQIKKPSDMLRAGLLLLLLSPISSLGRVRDAASPSCTPYHACCHCAHPASDAPPMGGVGNGFYVLLWCPADSH